MLYSILIISSLVIGILSGLVGIGAGMLTTVLLLALGYSYQNVVATTLFLHILPQTIPGFIEYYRQGHFILFDSIIIWIGITLGITIGSYYGAREYVPKKTLNMILSSLLIFSGIYIMYYNNNNKI